MRAWLDTEKRRRWAAIPSSSREEGSKAASRTGAVDMNWQDDGSRFGNWSENLRDGRRDQFAREGGEGKLRWRYLETGH